MPRITGCVGAVFTWELCGSTTLRAFARFRDKKLILLRVSGYMPEGYPGASE
jgi:hypothetical protein